MIVVVDDWRGTFHIPDDVERRLHAGPRWLVPAGGLLGALVAVHLLWWSEAGATAGMVVGFLVFLGCAAALALNLGGPRGVTVAIAGATAGWVVGATAQWTSSDIDHRLVAAFLAVGVIGNAVYVEHSRIGLARDRHTVRAARGGTRSDGWVVAVTGDPWDRYLRIEAADASGGPWIGSHGGWRAVRPGVGHPVGVWRARPADTAVVLLPRIPG